jgi:hypothetical protein
MQTHTHVLPGPVVDETSVSEVYAAEAIGFLFHAGNVHITFATPRANHSGTPAPMTRAVIARLVLPVTGAQALATGLYNFLRQQGFDPSAKPSDSTMQ